MYKDRNEAVADGMAQVRAHERQHAPRFTVAGAFSGKVWAVDVNLDSAEAWGKPYDISREALAELGVGGVARAYPDARGITIRRIA